MPDTPDVDFDPQLAPLLEAFPDIPLNAETLPPFREAIRDMAVLPDPATHAGVTIEEVKLPAADSVEPGRDLRCLLYSPVGDRDQGTSALVHIHGGGFVMGLPEMDAGRNIALVEQIGCTILSVDYRLAPEHPHPAGLEDCHAALCWLAERAGGDARLGVIGESAGGELAAATALLARDRGSAALACQALIYPMLCPPGEAELETDRDARIGRYVWPRESNAFGWASYLSGHDGLPGTLAIGASELGGLPPAFIAVGELDLFVHDSLAFASRLMAAGTSVEAHCYPGAFHGFDRMVEADVTQRFTRELVGFLKRHL